MKLFRCLLGLWLVVNGLSSHLKALDLPDRWVYCSVNLLVEKNVDDLEQIMRRAAKAGYTGILLSDFKSSKLGELDARYFRNAERVKKIATELGLNVVPALFPIGYSEAILGHDPNLVEALPVKEMPLEVRGGEARVVPDASVRVKGGDFADLKQWGWVDPTLVPDQGAVRVTDLANGQNARASQKLQLKPFRQYHLSVRIKTENLKGQPEVKLLAGKRGLNYASLGVKPTQAWKMHHVVFNTLDRPDPQLYLGVWGGCTGSVWFDDVQLEEVALLNVVRRGGAPLVITREDGTVLKEGRDFQSVTDPRMGTVPWKGGFEVWHEPPALKTALPDGTKLKLSYYHAITVHDGQTMICPSEPRTVELLRDQAKRMHALWGAKGYMMSHDEIRVLNWCDACQKRNLSAGAILADNAKTCVQILREVNPSGKIYVWNDMFDPFHNAHDDYYLVRDNLAGSWEGLDKGVNIVAWYFGKRDQSLKFFTDRGHQVVVAGYYDHNPEQVAQWLDSAKKVNGVTGVMYTTWQHKYGDLEKFAEVVKRYQGN